MVSKFNVLIIGAGNIGAFWDTPKSPKVLTHAHAFSNHPGFQLLGFVDIDPSKAKKAAAVWSCQAFDSINQAFIQNQIDIVCVATPDRTHELVLLELTKYPQRLVLTEKPLTLNFAGAKKLINIYKQKKLPMVVNYSRRYIEEFSNLQDDINDGLYGKFNTGTGYYGKGLLHNGSHLIDLVRQLVGEVVHSQKITIINDYEISDPSVTAKLSFDNGGELIIQAIDSRLFTVFELDLFFSNGRIIIRESGVSLESYKVKVDPNVPGYKKLVKVDLNEINLFKALPNLVTEIYEHLTVNKELKYNAIEALKTLEVCELIKK